MSTKRERQVIEDYKRDPVAAYIKYHTPPVVKEKKRKAIDK